MNPIYVDDVNVKLFVAMFEPGNPADVGTVQIWTDAGFGRVDPSTWGTVFPQSASVSPYTFYLDQDTGSHWICPQAKWQTTDLTQLQTDSWRLMNFLISRDYVYPELPLLLTWAKVTDLLHVGISLGDTVIIAQRTDNSWEWTIRGAGGTNVWTLAPDLLAAKTAAAQALGT